jgi:hypothetical protein
MWVKLLNNMVASIPLPESELPSLSFEATLYLRDYS